MEVVGSMDADLPAFTGALRRIPPLILGAFFWKKESPPLSFSEANSRLSGRLIKSFPATWTRAKAFLDCATKPTGFVLVQLPWVTGSESKASFLGAFPPVTWVRGPRGEGAPPLWGRVDSALSTSSNDDARRVTNPSAR